MTIALLSITAVTHAAVVSGRVTDGSGTGISDIDVDFIDRTIDHFGTAAGGLNRRTVINRTHGELRTEPAKDQRHQSGGDADRPDQSRQPHDT